MTRKSPSRLQRDLTPVHSHAAAVDIGARMHVAAVSPRCDPGPVRTFGTFTGDLQRLADWFEQCRVATVALESTGVYWISLYEILTQRGFAVVVVNAHEVKQVPGRKTDVCDAQWLQRLHCEAAQRPNMRYVAVKDEEQQARTVVFRARDLLVQQRTQLINALRGHLTEYGCIVPKEPAHVARLIA